MINRRFLQANVEQDKIKLITGQEGLLCARRPQVAIKKIRNKPIICYCGTLTERKRITKKVQIGQQDVLLENVDVDVCPNCGEIYFDGKMLLDFEKAVKVKSVEKTYR